MLCASDVRSSCRIIPGLTKEQLDLCYRANDVTRAALDGLDLAIRECQSQVRLLPNPNQTTLTPTALRSLRLVPVASMELFIIEYEETESAFIESIEERWISGSERMCIWVSHEDWCSMATNQWNNCRSTNVMREEELLHLFVSQVTERVRLRMRYRPRE